MHRTPAARRYRRRSTIIAAVYIALVAANTVATHGYAAPVELLAALAVVSALPIIALLVALGIYLREESDEYVRDSIVMSMVFGLGALLSLSSLLGMLQFAGVVGPLPVFLAFPIWWAASGIARCVIGWRDGRSSARA